MTIHDDNSDIGVRAALQRAIGDEPPLRLHAASVARHGARRLHRRRAIAVGATMLAVATLTAGVALGVPRLAGTIGAAGTHPVPGCAAVLRTDDPAVTAWRNGSTAAVTHASSPTGPSPSLDTGATSSSSVDEALASATSAAPTTRPTDAFGQPVPAWLTTAKSATMAAAFAAAIPTGVHLSAPAASAQAGPLPFAAGSNVAGGGVVVSVGSARAYLTIYVQEWDQGAPPCTADLARRYTSPDGSITDVVDEPGTSETGHYMLAECYRPDGTLVTVGLNNSGGIVPPTTTLPLTVAQLAAIAALPALAITAR